MADSVVKVVPLSDLLQIHALVGSETRLSEPLRKAHPKTTAEAFLSEMNASFGISTKDNIGHASSRKASPGQVSFMLPLVRPNSFTPSWLSSSLIALDSGEASIWTRVATRAKLCSSATIRK